MKCYWFNIQHCQSCELLDLSYEETIEKKQEHLKSLFHEYDLNLKPTIGLFDKVEHSRNKAKLGVATFQNKISFGFWNIDINKTLNLLRFHNIPVIVANTDMIYPKSNREINMAAGSVSRLLENILGRSFIKFGKPDSQMFMYGFDIVNKYQITAKSDILMVGDTLHTDILGGNKFGLATALALTGNTSESEAAFLIRSSNIIPDYLCDSAGI